MFFDMMAVFLKLKRSWSDEVCVHRPHIVRQKTNKTMQAPCVCVIVCANETAPFIHRDMRDSYLTSLFSVIFTDTSLYWDLILSVLFIYLSKIWQILWHSALFSNLVFLDSVIPFVFSANTERALIMNNINPKTGSNHSRFLTQAVSTQHLGRKRTSQCLFKVQILEQIMSVFWSGIPNQRPPHRTGFFSF